VVLAHDAVLSQQHRARDTVLELAHVARPVIAGHQLDRWGADALHVAAVLLGVAFQEVVREQGDVRFAVA
jgi:hypothetical protein